MNFDYKTFEIELKEKTKNTFIGCTEKLNIKDISGFALYSDNSAMTISVSCNTYEHLKEMQEEEKGYNEYFKWTPGEWKYEMINAKEFKNLSSILSDSHFETNNASFLTHRNRIYNIAVKVLEQLKNENLFKETSNDFVLMFAVSDFSEPELEISFVKRLNSEIQSDEFEQWVLSESN
jgi:Domain of unknown function (DUF4303)